MSLFQPSTIGDLAIRVLLVPPTGGTSAVTHQLDTTVGLGRTTIEERRPARAGLLLTQRCTVQALADELDDFRKGLAALGPTLVAMPLWIDALPVESWDDRIYEPSQVINFTPGLDDFVIYAADALPETPDYSHYAPLLIGRFKERPKLAAHTDNFAEFEITLREASPWSCRIGVNSYGDAWSFTPDWTSEPEELNEHAIEQIALEGVAAREVGLDAVNAAARWHQSAGFTFVDRLEIRGALTWFVGKQGMTHAWSDLPAWLKPGTASGVAPHSYTARFASDALTLAYLTGEIARADIGFVQEIATPGRDQAQPGETYLYRFAYRLDPDGPELYTNWDAPLVAAEGTYQPSQLTHQELLLSLKPQDVKAELSMAFREGSLMHDWIRGRLYADVTLTVWQCDPADAAGTRGAPIFEGQVTNVLPEGNVLRVTAKLLGKLFATRVPGWVFGPRCNTYVFSEYCTLSEASYRSAGTCEPSDLSSDGLTLTVHSVTGWGGTSYAANWFAGGLVRLGTGRQAMRATIMTSVMSAGALVITLNRPLWADMIDEAGADVELVPGCDGQYLSSCVAKYDNGLNFRAFPFVPDFIEQAGLSSPDIKK